MHFDDVSMCKRHNKSHAILLTTWDTDLDREGMVEIKKEVKDELKEDFDLKYDTIKNSVDRKDRIISQIENMILFLQGYPPNTLTLPLIAINSSNTDRLPV